MKHYKIMIIILSLIISMFIIQFCNKNISLLSLEKMPNQTFYIFLKYIITFILGVILVLIIRSTAIQSVLSYNLILVVTSIMVLIGNIMISIYYMDILSFIGMDNKYWCIRVIIDDENRIILSLLAGFVFGRSIKELKNQFR
ncbi:hypothetical protein E0485_22570 [Paenibacillus albiflavus]|uniref:Uncharacterized protein n=1 Tax=Paenibacillus albiflavus TaxID=2545760 RepID=A0A4R4E142_9BACL|nr:hypothetical protein [Paenibacillus albiflavus]TCZ71852.1 hypothetical protein E0485_22570 [Paenibacillus albiflavus]